MNAEKQLLADFLMGDLAPEEMEEVKEALASDPQLRALYVQLRRSQLPMAAAPPQTAWEEPERRRGSSPVWLAAVAVAAVVLLSIWTLPGTPLPEGQLALIAQTHQASPESQHAFVAEHDPEQLVVAFQARGLDPAMAMVADLDHLGLELVGGQLEGDGAVVVYVDSLGRRFECHMLSDGPTGTPSTVMQRDGAPDLEVYGLGSATAVVWREKGMICVLVSEHREALLALAQAKVWGVVG